MKKRILALALAGTTAFSVFGGLNVFAVNDDGEYEAYTPVVLTFKVADAASNIDGGSTGLFTMDSTTIKGVNGSTDFNTSAANMLKLFEDTVDYTDLYNFATAVVLNDDDFADTTEEVKSGKIYMYDYAKNKVTGLSTQDVVSDIQDFISAYDDAKAFYDANKSGSWNEQVPTDAAAKATALDAAEDALLISLIKLYGGSEVTFEKEYGTTNDSVRRTVTSEFESFAEDVRPVSDFMLDNQKVPYKYDQLVAAIEGVSDIGETQSSVMYNLMQEYEEIVPNMDEADTEGVDDTIERYVGVLDARDSSDYKSSSSYYKFLGFYTDAQEDYADADTWSELNEYAQVLKAIMLGDTFDDTNYSVGDSAGVDKDALKDTIATADELVKSGDFKKTTDEWKYFSEILAEAKLVSNMSKTKSYQTTVNAYTDLLSEAMDALEANSSPADWEVLRLETAVENGKEKVETDYTASSWKNFTTALEAAEKGLESSNLGSTRAKALAEGLEGAMEHLSPKSVPFTLRNDLKDAIAEAEDLMDEMTDTASGTQLLTLSKAIDDAKDIQKKIATKETLISEVEGAIADIESAMTLAQHPQGWYQNEEGTWFYGVGTTNKTGWLELNGRTYFLKDDGSMAANTWVKTEAGYWYYLNASGAMMHDGWAKINDTWYYFKNFGGMAEGWVKDGNTWYYLTPGSGAMVSNGWSLINGKYYYFDASGAMLANTTTPDGYKVDASGAWVK